MPRAVIRICPSYLYNPLTRNSQLSGRDNDYESYESFSSQSNWEYNTIESAKYFYESTDPLSISIYPSNVRVDGNLFHFDKLYDSILSQHDFYRFEIRDLLGFLVNGQLANGGLPTGNNEKGINSSFKIEAKSRPTSHRDVTILSFGDFFSGDRFTLHGPPEHPGIIYRSLKDLFSYRDIGLYNVSLSCYSIDQQSEQIFDAFEFNQKKKKNIQIRLRDHPKRGVIVEGISRIPADSPENAMSLLNQIYIDQTTNFKKSHVVTSINLEWKNPLPTDSKGIISSINFVSLNAPTDGKGNILPKTKQPDWTKLMKTCLDGLMNRSPSIPFHKSKTTNLIRDLLVGNRPGLIIHSLSPNIESYKTMIWSIKLCQKMKDVSPQTKPQFSSPSQSKYNNNNNSDSRNEIDEIPNEKSFTQIHPSQSQPKARPPTSQSLQVEQNSLSTPINPHVLENSIDRPKQLFSPFVEHSQASQLTTNNHFNPVQYTIPPKSYQSPQIQSQVQDTMNNQRFSIQRSLSKQSISTINTQVNVQDDSELIALRKESASLKSEVEILKRLKATHERKISQLEDNLEMFRIQHSDAVRAIKKNSKKDSPSEKNALSQKDFDMYREVMEQAITRLKETQNTLEEQNDALKKAIQKKDQDLRKKEKELILLKKSYDGDQTTLERIELEKQQLEKKVKSFEKKIQQLEKVDQNKQTEIEVPDGFVLIKQEKISKYENYIKETVELNDILRAEALKQSQVIERYQQQFGGISNLPSNESTETEEQLRKQLHVVKTALADALKQLALSNNPK